MQRELVAEDLPEAAIEAASSFHARYLDQATHLLAGAETSALAIVLPPAPHDHVDWRRTLARDLARAHAPKRVNVIGAALGEGREYLLAYLRDAPGVTGQYLSEHE